MPWHLINWWLHCLHFLATHVYREGNKVAYLLSKAALSYEETWFSSFPDFVWQLILMTFVAINLFDSLFDVLFFFFVFLVVLFFLFGVFPLGFSKEVLIRPDVFQLPWLGCIFYCPVSF